MRHFAIWRKRVEAEGVAVVAHRFEVDRTHFRAARVGHVATVAIERSMSFRRFESIGFQMFEMIEFQTRVFFQIRGKRHALRCEFAGGVPAGQVDFELGMRCAEIADVIELARVLRVRFQTDMAVRTQSLIGADQTARAVVILMTRAAFGIAELRHVEFRRIGMCGRVRVARETRIVAHGQECFLVALLAVVGEELVRRANGTATLMLRYEMLAPHKMHGAEPAFNR